MRAVTAVACGSDVIATFDQLPPAASAAPFKSVMSIMIGVPGAIAAVTIPGTASPARLSAMGHCGRFTRIAHQPAIAASPGSFASRRLILRAWTAATRSGKENQRPKGTSAAASTRRGFSGVIALTSASGGANHNMISSPRNNRNNPGDATSPASPGPGRERATTTARTAPGAASPPEFNDVHSIRSGPVTVRLENLCAF